MISKRLWNDVEDNLPEEQGIYSVCKRVHSTPTFAIFVKLTGKWMITINNTYWEISGVHYWKVAPKTPKAALEAK